MNSWVIYASQRITKHPTNQHNSFFFLKTRNYASSSRPPRWWVAVLSLRLSLFAFIAESKHLVAFARNRCITKSQQPCVHCVSQEGDLDGVIITTTGMDTLVWVGLLQVPQWVAQLAVVDTTTEQLLLKLTHSRSYMQHSQDTLCNNLCTWKFRLCLVVIRVLFPECLFYYSVQARRSLLSPSFDLHVVHYFIKDLKPCSYYPFLGNLAFLHGLNVVAQTRMLRESIMGISPSSTCCMML